MTVLVERRQIPHDRQRVASITALWAALTLLAATAALLQPDVETPHPPPPPPVKRAAVPPPPSAPPVHDGVVGSWIGVVPNTSEPLAEPVPTF